MPVYAGVESIHWGPGGSLFLRIDRLDSGSGRARRAFGGPVSVDMVACFPKACFIGKKEFRNLRDPSHVQRLPDG